MSRCFAVSGVSWGEARQETLLGGSWEVLSGSGVQPAQLHQFWRDDGPAQHHEKYYQVYTHCMCRSSVSMAFWSVIYFVVIYLITVWHHCDNRFPLDILSVNSGSHLFEERKLRYGAESMHLLSVARIQFQHHGGTQSFPLFSKAQSMWPWPGKWQRLLLSLQ